MATLINASGHEARLVSGETIPLEWITVGAFVTNVSWGQDGRHVFGTSRDVILPEPLASRVKRAERRTRRGFDGFPST